MRPGKAPCCLTRSHASPAGAYVRLQDGNRSQPLPVEPEWSAASGTGADRCQWQGEGGGGSGFSVAIAEPHRRWQSPENQRGMKRPGGSGLWQAIGKSQNLFFRFCPLHSVAGARGLAPRQRILSAGRIAPTPSAGACVRLQDGFSGMKSLSGVVGAAPLQKASPRRGRRGGVPTKKSPSAAP